MLTADALCVIRNDRIVLHAVNLALPPGGALLLLGPNGAGKSTLLRVLAGLRRPEAGCMRWHGEDIAGDPAAHRRRVAYLSHRDAVKPSLTARENLAFDRAAHGGDAAAALEAFGLLALADAPVRLFSAGQRRRLALARLTLGDRPLWLLDEPLNGLDAQAEALLLIAQTRHRARGGMVIAATHASLPLRDAATLRLAAP